MLHTAILSKKLLAFLTPKLIAIAIGAAAVPFIKELFISEAYSISVLSITAIKYLRDI